MSIKFILSGLRDGGDGGHQRNNAFYINKSKTQAKSETEAASTVPAL